MLVETIKLLRKSLERLDKSDNDIEELTKILTNLKVTKKSRSPFVTWSEEELRKNPGIKAGFPEIT